MPMIQGIDAGALINAFRQGRQDRFSDEETRMKIASQRAALDRQTQVRGLLGVLAGGQQPGAISGAYASPNPTAAPKPTFDSAFSPDAMGSIANGTTPPVAAPAAAAPQPPPQAPPRAQFNPDVMRQLMFLDPETGQKLASGLKAMSETELAQRQAQNDASGLAAHYLMKFPPQERQARLQHVIPILQQNGVPPEGIQRLAGNLSDEALQAFTGMAIDFDKLMDNERAERELNMGKVITPQPGAGAFVQKPDGRIETIVAPNDGTHVTGAPVHGGSAIPKGAADYLRQHPELRGQFDEKYGAGSADRILGGGASNGTGGFP